MAGATHAKEIENHPITNTRAEHANNKILNKYSVSKWTFIREREQIISTKINSKASARRFD